MTSIKSPWTPEQVAALQAYQDAGYMHPFTCPTENHSSIGNLVPTARGWVCQFCDYTQDWAHDFMFLPPVHPLEAMGFKNYTADQQRVCDYIQKISDNQVGCSDDPIGFLLSSHALLRDRWEKSH